MTTLLLHVGLHKTATSSFQFFLCEHDEDLARHGCLYPKTARAPGPQHALLPGCYFPGHPFLPVDRSLSVEGYIGELFKELALAPCSLCVLSSEVFTELLSFDREALRDLIGRLSCGFQRLVILLTLRDVPQLAYSDLKNRLRDISRGLRQDIVFSAPAAFDKIERDKYHQREMWRSLEAEIVERSMDGSCNPVESYFGVIMDLLPECERFALKNELGKDAFGGWERNTDPFPEIVYLLVIISGLKIAAAGKSVKTALTLKQSVSFLRSRKEYARWREIVVDSSQVIAFLRCLKTCEGDIDFRSFMQRVSLAPAVADFIDLLSDHLVDQLVG